MGSCQCGFLWKEVACGTIKNMTCIVYLIMVLSTKVIITMSTVIIPFKSRD
jgi:hypothetical protein